MLKLNQSIYDDGHAESTCVATLEGHHVTQTVVIGAGITGLSTAWHLAKAGQQVIVLEANHVGYGASGRNGGQVNAGLKGSKAATIERFGAVVGERFWDLAQAAPMHFLNWLESEQLVCGLHRGGTLKASRLMRGPSAMQQMELAALGQRWCNREQMREFTGSDYYLQGVFDPNGASIEPRQLLSAWAQKLRTQGVTIYEHSRASRVIQARLGVRVETAQGTVMAENLVLATDGYSDHLWPQLQRSIIPIYSCILATEPLPNGLADVILPKRPVVYETQRVTVYYRKDAMNRLILGGRGPQRELRSVADVLPILKHARGLWPDLKEVGITHAWNGQFALTPDYYPRLHRPAPRVWAGLGYSGRGVAMGFVMGQQLAKSICGSDDGHLSIPVTAIESISGQRWWKWGVEINTRLYSWRDRVDQWLDRYYL